MSSLLSVFTQSNNLVSQEGVAVSPLKNNVEGEGGFGRYFESSQSALSESGEAVEANVEEMVNTQPHTLPASGKQSESGLFKNTLGGEDYFSSALLRPLSATDTDIEPITSATGLIGSDSLNIELETSDLSGLENQTSMHLLSDEIDPQAFTDLAEYVDIPTDFIAEPDVTGSINLSDAETAPLPVLPLKQEQALPGNNVPVVVNGMTLDLKGIVSQMNSLKVDGTLTADPAQIVTASQLKSGEPVPDLNRIIPLATEAKTESTTTLTGTSTLSSQGSSNASQALLTPFTNNALLGTGQKAGGLLMSQSASLDTGVIESLTESNINSKPLSGFDSLIDSRGLNAALETASSRVQIPVNVKFGHPAWAGMVAERSAMMASQKIEFAELQLDPPELGPLQVKVTVNQEQASVTFVSASPQVRDALEQSSYKLRELLDEQSLDLVDVNVSDQSAGEGDEGEEAQQTESAETGQVDGEEPDTPIQQAQIMARYGVDHYA